jgi:class 3 adenylate cyclase
MSETTYNFVRDEFSELRALGEAQLAGLEAPVAVFTVSAIKAV